MPENHQPGTETPMPEENKKPAGRRLRGRAGPGLAYLNWAAITFLLACFIVLFQPDEFTQPVDEYSYQLFNRLFGSVVYDAPNKDDIGIVLLDQKSLYDLDTSWPPLFMTHAMVLKSFLRRNAPLPLAVFIDFTLQDSRNSQASVSPEGVKAPQFSLQDSTLDELVRVVDAYNKLGIPIYVSAGRYDDIRFPEILSELKGKVKLVAGWGDARSSADIRALNYALFPNRPGSEGQNEGADKGSDDQIKAPDFYPAAALQIYLDLCARQADAKAQGRLKSSSFANRNWNCDGALMGDIPAIEDQKRWQQRNLDLWRGYAADRSMNLVWPDSQSDYAGWPVMETVTTDQDGKKVNQKRFPANCPSGRAKDLSYFVGVIHDFVVKTGFGRSGDANFCSPFDVVTAGQAQKGTPTAEDSWIGQLGGRVIFYSFNLQGLQDVVHPPTLENDISGVNVHAMALENLLHFGPAYLSNTARTDKSLGALNSDNLELLSMLGLFLIRLLILIVVRRFGGPGSGVDQGDRTVEATGAADQAEERVCTLLDGALLYYRTVFFDFAGWLKRLPERVVWFLKDTCCTFRQWRLPVFLILLIEAIVIVVFVLGIAFWLEFSVLRIAPSNWLSILGLAGLTYPVYIRALFSQSPSERSTAKIADTPLAEIQSGDAQK
ncbi:CHASE2 domain-containing protein [Thalassospira marina]|uniref:CHASE2 domain-containing protein n=1 Tax=Thalassospira marina TaxID=2048283 RepID=A0A2N3KSJ8_9PROT|nr:CHASE2 domain-containing protein [Thalassospira marina]PKR53497.1 hypothetical protein COO20_13215 [Thalassospira marina]